MIDGQKRLLQREELIFVAGAGGFVCGKSEDTQEWDAIRDVSQLRNS